MKQNNDIYMDDIREFEILTIKEETELFKAYRERGSRKAFNEILNSNTRFVLKVAFHYKKATKYELDDLVGAGNIGMIQAMDTYVYGKPGMRFTQWAVYAIRAAILTEIANQGGFLCIHGNEADKNNQLRKAITRLQQVFEREPTNEELSEETGIKAKHIAHMRTVLIPQTSLDAPLPESESLHQVLAAATEKGENSELVEKISKILNVSGLDSLHKDVLCMYFGIGYQISYCLQEIADKYDRSREGIRVIKKRALNELAEFNDDQIVNSELHLTMELIHE